MFTNYWHKGRDMIMTHEQMFARNIELHPWRDRRLFDEIAVFCEREQIPFCMECGDWHHPNEDHSYIEEDDES